MKLTQVALGALLALTLVAGALATPLLTIAVIPGDYNDDWQQSGVDIMGGTTEMLTNALIQSGQFIVLSREQIDAVITEQDFAESGRVAQARRAAETGVIIPAQILVRASITEWDPGSEGGGQGLNIRGFNIGLNRSSAHVAMMVEMIDSTTGEVIASERVEGHPQGSGISYGFADRDWGFGMEDFRRQPIGEALQIAIDNAVERIAERLRGTPWQGNVVTVRDGEVYINAGRNAQIQPGEVFAVFDEGEALIDPNTGMNLGSVESEVGMIEVTRVEERFSICRPIDDARYQPGQIVRVP